MATPPEIAKSCTLVFQLEDTVRLFGTLLLYDLLHLPKGDSYVMIGQRTKKKICLL